MNDSEGVTEPFPRASAQKGNEATQLTDPADEIHFRGSTSPLALTDSGFI